MDTERSGKPVQSTDEQHRKRYASAILEARRRRADSFQGWFNRSHGIEQSFVRGHWDFAIHILTPMVCCYLSEPEEKVALEICYGGGRILNAACGFFGKVIGIDIHEDQDAVELLLKARGKTNFQLLRTDGSSLGVPPESVDFVHSFIVLQHLQSYGTFIGYLKAVYHCLKPGGVAQLYYGRYGKVGWRDQLRNLAKGYCGLKGAPVNHTSLVIRSSKVNKECRALGFEVLGGGHSFKQVPD
jgi:SAM-dependent methyltransferase